MENGEIPTGWPPIDGNGLAKLHCFQTVKDLLWGWMGKNMQPMLKFMDNPENSL